MDPMIGSLNDKPITVNHKDKTINWPSETKSIIMNLEDNKNNDNAQEKTNYWQPKRQSNN